MMRLVSGLVISAWLVVGCGGTTSSGDGRAGDAGSPSTGGTAAGGAGGAQAGGSGGGIDCSVVGCAAPPLCSTGCTEPCGCCRCAQLSTENGLTCVDGCWVDGCTYDGQFQPVGASFPDADRCNTCTCSPDGLIACTTMDCLCDPAGEIHWRSYLTTDPAECAVIDYECIDNTTPFSNDCGCGCQQASSCPEWFDCMPSSGTPSCDEAAIHAQCPFSGIAY